jgi:hypothetical protein
MRNCLLCSLREGLYSRSLRETSCSWNFLTAGLIDLYASQTILLLYKVSELLTDSLTVSKLLTDWQMVSELLKRISASVESGFPLPWKADFRFSGKQI